MGKKPPKVPIGIYSPKARQGLFWGAWIQQVSGPCQNQCGQLDFIRQGLSQPQHGGLCPLRNPTGPGDPGWGSPHQGPGSPHVSDLLFLASESRVALTLMTLPHPMMGPFLQMTSYSNLMLSLPLLMGKAGDVW